MAKKKSETIAEEIVEVEVTETKTPTPQVLKRAISADTEIEVQSNYAGTLVYRSKKTSELIVWSSLGDVNPMTFDELQTMRNTQRGFIENNWIIPVGENAAEAIKQLRIDRYYKDVINLTEIEKIFKLKPEDLIKKVEPLRREVKDSIGVAACTLIEEGELSDLKVINALEKAIGYKILER